MGAVMSVTKLPKVENLDLDRQLQLNAAGQLQHLLTLNGLSKQHISALLDQSQQYLSPMGEAVVRSDVLRGRTVANLFFEASTRTRASFDLAARRLGADVLNLDVNTSSRKKGESILDTMYTLQAMQVDIFVVRDASAGVPAFIARHLDNHISVLNAGESTVSHPTQGLLDLLTIRQHKPDFSKLIVAIVGDILHSRAARSQIHALRILGVKEIRVIGPKTLIPTKIEAMGVVPYYDMDKGLELKAAQQLLIHKRYLHQNGK